MEGFGFDLTYNLKPLAAAAIFFKQSYKNTQQVQIHLEICTYSDKLNPSESQAKYINTSQHCSQIINQYQWYSNNF